MPCEPRKLHTSGRECLPSARGAARTGGGWLLVGATMASSSSSAMHAATTVCTAKRNCIRTDPSSVSESSREVRPFLLRPYVAWHDQSRQSTREESGGKLSARVMELVVLEEPRLGDEVVDGPDVGVASLTKVLAQAVCALPLLRRTRQGLKAGR